MCMYVSLLIYENCTKHGRCYCASEILKRRMILVRVTLFEAIQLASQPASQPARQPASQPSIEPANQSASKPTRQPGDQSANQPTSHCCSRYVASRLVGWLSGCVAGWLGG